MCRVRTRATSPLRWPRPCNRLHDHAGTCRRRGARIADVAMAVRRALGYPPPRMRKINFTRGVPAEESFPTEALVDCMTAALRGPNVPSIMQYGPSYGFMPLRTQLAQQFGVQPESVLLGNGSLGLIDLVGLTMIEP